MHINPTVENIVALFTAQSLRYTTLSGYTKDMSYRSLTTALTLYKSGALTLEGAANHSGVRTEKVVSALQSRGIPIREFDREVSDKRQFS